MTDIQTQRKKHINTLMIDDGGQAVGEELIHIQMSR